MYLAPFQGPSFNWLSDNVITDDNDIINLNDFFSDKYDHDDIWYREKFYYVRRSINWIEYILKDQDQEELKRKVGYLIDYHEVQNMPSLNFKINQCYAWAKPYDEVFDSFKKGIYIYVNEEASTYLIFKSKDDQVDVWGCIHNVFIY